MRALSRPIARDDAWVVRVDPARRGSHAPDAGDGAMAVAPGLRVHVGGVIFDTASLARRLGVPGRPSHSPAALVLAAYQQQPDTWLDGLAGHFAIVIDDSRRDTVIAVRDRMGQHPLFYARTAGTLRFSWSIDALLAEPGVSGELHRLALADHLVHRWPDITETYFAAIRRVPPGHLLEARGGEIRLRRYWDLAAKAPLAIGEQDAREMFDAALDRAVHRCLDQGPAAVFLSGGLDSISIAAVAADRARRDGHAVPRALSLGFPDPACDEEFVQRSAAETLGVEQDFVRFADAIGSRGLLVQATELSATLPAPLLNVWNPAYARLARVARDHGRAVVMTGTGGDEWLSVTPYLAADLLRRGDLAGFARFTGVLQRSYRMSRLEALYGAAWRFGARPLAGMVLDRAVPGLFRAQRTRRMVASTPAWVAPDRSLRAEMDARAHRTLAVSQPPNGSFYEQEMRTALDHTLMSVESEESFEFGQRTGVRMLHPYCDADLVELLYRMPPALLTAGGRAKGLVRDTVARRFPALGFDRQRKVNATGFYQGILQREGPAAWDSINQGAALAGLGVIDQPRLDDAMRGRFRGRDTSERYRIWSVLNLAAWTHGRLGCSTKGR